MNKSRGFIFLMTLIIISVISLLLISCMQQILLYHKTLNKQEQRHQSFYELEHLAMQLASTKSLNKSCMEYGDSPNRIIKELSNNEGCEINAGKYKYKYIIEDLGDFPCLIVQKGKISHATQHLRISIISSGDEEHAASLLQIRVIKPIGALECVGKKHLVSLGISSWRYLPFLN